MTLQDVLRTGQGEAGGSARGRRAGGQRVAVFALGWLLGAASVLGWATLSGGWYEHYLPESEAQAREMVNTQGWELVSERGEVYLRRPRLSFHGVRPPVLPGPAPQATATPLPSRPRPTPGAAAAGETLTLSGTADTRTTEPFQLSGGTYRVEWSARAAPDRNCHFRARLRATDERVLPKDIASRSLPVGQSAEGVAYVHNVERGLHYLDLTPLVGQACQWTMSLARE